MTAGPATWIVRLFVAGLIVAAGYTYVRGRRRLQTEPMAYAGDDRRSLISFLAGLALLALVVVTPLADLSTRYFSARSLQHMLLVASIPALLVMANPVPSLTLGLPSGLRHRLHGLGGSPGAPATGPGVRPVPRLLRSITAPGVTLIAFLCICWFWYDPLIHQATLRYGWVHALELLTLFGVSLLNWWHISGVRPRVHGLMPPVVRILYTTISIWPLKIVGLILLFIPTTFYAYPATWRFSGLNIDDYIFGAMLTWIIGGAAYVMTAILLTREWLSMEEVKPILPESAWATDEAMLAPGIKR